jgi:hypothetical protein
MKTVNLILTLVLAGTFFSCGSDSSPEGVGAGIYEKYYDFLKETNDVIAKGGASCKQIDEIADKYKKELIELGKKREAFSPEDKTKCDAATMDKSRDIYVTQTAEYKAYIKFMDDVQKDDYQCYSRLSDYLILAQYGNFDLLNKQMPEEAKKYGVNK